MSEIIRLEDVVKRYRVGVERSNLRSANPWRRYDPASEGETVTALDGVSLSVSSGESLGIIGDNGTGKSTLLKLVAGVVAPTEGRVLTRGRIASIIELGVGFHDDLTGYENLEFTAALMGMPFGEIRRRRDQMIEFSGIEHAIHTPVKRYSSGMLARLGFAVATHVDADVVLVDEVLAVGDIDFQRRSLERLEELNRDGVTTVIISHNLAAVAHLCTRVTRLDAGRLVADAEPEAVITEYGGSMAITNPGIGRVPVRLRELRIEPTLVDPKEPFTIEADIDVERPMPRGKLRLVLRPTAELVAAYGQEVPEEELFNVQILNVAVPSDVLGRQGSWRIRGEVAQFPMFPGTYVFALELTEDPHDTVLEMAEALIDVPGQTQRREALALPVEWSEDERRERDGADEPAG